MIPFFKKNHLADELRSLNNFYQGKVINPRNLVEKYLVEKYSYQNFFLTKSCTQSLNLALMTLGFPKGKEVIIPSYGFVSLANSVVINGLKCVFVDCEPDTMNISAGAIENAINENTVAVITINYGSVACDYDRIRNICRQNSLVLIEDNAHGIDAKYRDAYLGTCGDISTLSFDFYKNISCDEGGGITINHIDFMNSFVQSYYFGTNKKLFMQGHVSSYEWQHVGTNSLLAEHLAVILQAQLEHTEEIVDKYVSNWNFYFKELQVLENEGKIKLAKVPEYAQHNGHLFWIKLNDLNERNKLIDYLRKDGVDATFHYTPLHTSPYGKKHGYFSGEDINTSKESAKLLRLPQYFLLKNEEQEKIIENIFNFFK
ncbi:MAG: aminotransferase class I/II-fold pyridoxal phosphate-dependent enzyme [Chitinophagales bacterium]|nr:aminotransferase class I/II-fold pyridoxal phosphate-dependent enzyme [Chitinophagales bacterium]